MSKTVQAKASSTPKASRNKLKTETPPQAPQPVPQPASRDGRRIQVRKSGIHGKGVFALKPIAAGEFIIEYKGAIISWKEALRRHPHDPSQPNHTFYFHLDETHVIDGGEDGNAARWFNHSCDPNCRAEQDGHRVFVEALRDLQPGEELFYDYGLVIDERYTPQLKKDYECRCGSPQCRHTMLAPKRPKRG